MKIVFLNGPPRSGKDTIVKWLMPSFQISHLKFAAPLKRQCCALLQVSLEWLEENKDKPHPALKGGTPREYLINMSEKFIKPIYGDDFFGHVLASEAANPSMLNTILISDSGFECEAWPVVKRFGLENCVKVQLTRPGYDFSKDSRSYWHIDGMKNYNVRNNLTECILVDRVYRCLAPILLK